MKVHKFIKQQLEENKIAVIPQLGTFRSSSHNADMSDSGNLISPPDEAIVFEEDFQEQLEHSIASFIEKKTGEDEIDIATNVQLYVSTLRQTLNTEGIAEVEGLGYFTLDNGVLTFKQFDEVNMNPESFGLPKINAAPIIDDEEDEEEETKSNNTTLKALALVAVILAIFGAGAYFFLTGNTDKTEETLTEDVVETPSENNDEALSGPVDLDEAEATTPSQTSPEAQEKPEPTPEPEPQPEVETTTVTKPENNNSRPELVTNKTGHYYVIVSSFSSLENAQKSLKSLKRKGYTKAQVLRTPTNYKVAIEGFSNKTDANQLKDNVSTTFAGSWVYKN